jgi:hypothetical protein
MKLTDIIGKELADIRVKVEYESYGIDEADTFIIFKDGLVIGVPWSIDTDELVWQRDLDKESESIFKGKGDTKLKSLKGKKVVGFLNYDDSEKGFIEAEKVFIELEGETFITEITVAPNGTGLVGLWIFNSRKEIEQRYGTNYHRLHQH